MDSKVVTRNEKKIIGVEIRTSNQMETHQSTAKIPGAWSSFYKNDIPAKIPNRAEANIILGVYTRYESDHNGKYSLILGAEVTTLDNIPDGMTGITVPPAKYLKFCGKGKIPDVAIEMWQKIWASSSGNPDYKRTFTTDFEVYNSDNPDTLDIFIAVK